MTDILETLIQRLLKAERRVAALERREYTSGGGGGDHGGLAGLADDDHSQYHNDTRGDARYALTAKGVTNGDSHDHSGGDGAQIDHGGLAGLGDDDHTQYHNDTRGDARYALTAKGVTNGDSHNHNGGDGAQIDHGGLGGLADDDHSQYHTDARGDARYAPIGFVGCQAYNNANIAIGNASFTLVTLNSESYDSSSMHSTSTNTGRVIAPSAGYYLVSAKVKFAYNATGLRAMTVNVNSGGSIVGGTIIAYHAQMAVSSANFDTPFMVSTPVYLNANDYVEMFVYQNSTGNLNLLYVSEHTPYLALIKLK